MAEAAEVEVASPPRDGITALAYLAPKRLVCASWDAAVRVYDTEGNARVCEYALDGAVLACAVQRGGGALFAGGVARRVVRCDVETGALAALGEHEQPVRCLAWADARGLVLSASWDASVRAWDPRARAPAPPAHALPLPDKAVAMAVSDSLVAVGTIGRHILLYDVRALHAPLASRESTLKHQTRCIAWLHGGAAAGYAVGSIEGRIAVEYVDADAKPYAFKCHRSADAASGLEVAHPVNTIAVHPAYGSFASGGGDGFVSVWDPANKKRLCQYSRYPTSIAALAFAPDGAQLAIAVSYTFEEGERDHPPDSIRVRAVSDLEVRPKDKK